MARLKPHTISQMLAGVLILPVAVGAVYATRALTVQAQASRAMQRVIAGMPAADAIRELAASEGLARYKGCSPMDRSTPSYHVFIYGSTEPGRAYGVWLRTQGPPGDHRVDAVGEIDSVRPC